MLGEYVGIAIISGGLVALTCLFMAFRSLKCKRLVDDTPTSKTLGVFIGLAELKGTAESEAPLTSHLAGIPCVLYNWTIQEHWSRMVTETYRDAQGHTQTRTRHENGWTTIGHGEQSAPFYLKDETGVIRIMPEKAKVEDTEVFDKTCRRNDPLYFGKGPPNEIVNSDHQRRFHEEAIILHASLYVMGQARERQDIVAAEITKDKDAPIFLISTRSEKQISSSYGRWLWFWVVLGLITGIAGVLIGDMVSNRFVTVWQIIIAAAGFLLLLGFGWIWLVYNSLVTLRQRVKQCWSQVDIQLKRRHDLIPNLVQLVDGYSAHERQLQEVVAKMRQQISATPPGVEGPDYAGFVLTLRTAVEGYPDLKAGELFLKLQQDLANTEQRIALARDYFNNIASFYNARLEIVPDRFVAALTGFHEQILMSAADFERAPVRVKLVE